MNSKIIKIRAMEPEDLDLLYEIENDTALWDVGTTNVPYSRYALHDYVAHASNDIYADRQVRFMIDNEQEETIGIMDMVNFNPKHQRAELGIVIMNKFRGLGYGQAALREVVKYAQSVLHLHQLYVIVDVENKASIQLFQEQGFEQGAILKQWLYDGQKYHDALFLQTFL
jgi:diamine N-acetyltransferase